MREGLKRCPVMGGRRRLFTEGDLVLRCKTLALASREAGDYKEAH